MSTKSMEELMLDREEPRAGPNVTATREEIYRAYRELTEAQKNRMILYARYRLRCAHEAPAPRDHEDLIHDALVATASGSRPWHPNRVSFLMHLCGAMRSMTSNWSRPKAVRVTSDSEMADAVGSMRAVDGNSSNAWARLRELAERFEGDPLVMPILDALTRGLDGAETKQRLAITDGQYAEAARRIRDAIAEMEGGSHGR